MLLVFLFGRVEPFEDFCSGHYGEHIYEIIVNLSQRFRMRYIFSSFSLALVVVLFCGGIMFGKYGRGAMEIILCEIDFLEPLPKYSSKVIF